MKISVTMITMNEEKNIQRALSSCGFADEIVVVDGGSTDSTLDILKSHDKVLLVQRPWDNHFGRQRQVSLDHCSGDWIIRLDSAEAFSLAFEQNIRNLLSTTSDDVTAYKIRQCNLVGNVNYYSKIFDDFEFIPRIWRNTPDVRWERHIHEILTGFKGELKLCEVYVVHYGFLDKKRYWQKGQYYSQLPESGFDKAEQLYCREYDIQLRPPESAVAGHVQEYVAESEMLEHGEIAIIGQCMNILKLNNFKAISDKYNLTICVDEKTDIDYSQEEYRVIQFPHDAGGSVELTGLEFELFDKDIIFTEGLASTCTCQAILAKLKFGIKVITIITDTGPVDNEMNDEIRATKEMAARYVDVFIADSEHTRDALLSDGVSNDRIVLIPMGKNIDMRNIKNHESAIKYGNMFKLVERLYLSTFKGAISELAEFINLSEMNTLMRIRSVYYQQIQDWQCSVGKDVTKSRVAEFYSDTDSYLFDLVQYNYENTIYIKWSQDVFNFIADLNKVKDHLEILDFGGGIGSQLINVSALKDVALNYADIPGKTFEFARWRFNRRNLNINMIDAKKEDFLGNMMFDVVFAFDVIEHLVDPEESVDYLIRHIKPDGFLLAITSFNDNEGEAAWHLNVDKYSNEGFYSFIKSLGMEMMTEGIPRVFRKDKELSGLIENMKTAEHEKRTGDVRRYMESYLKLRPVDLEMLIKHADLCSSMGCADAAMESLNKIRLFNPAMPEIREIEDRLKNRRIMKLHLVNDQPRSSADLEAIVPENTDRVLHIGCGDGESGRRLLERGARKVVGIDIDGTAIDLAKSNITDVMCGTIEEIDLPYDKGYFDCIIIENSLEYLNNPLNALKKLKAYLSDTGEVIAVIPNTGNIFKINKLVDGRWDADTINYSNDTPLRFYTRKEIEKLFSDAGYELTGLSSGLMSPEFHELDVTASNDIATGRVLLKGLSPEEIRDMYTVNYLIRGRKKGIEYKKLVEQVNALLDSKQIKEAQLAVEKYLEMYLADTNALLLHADICLKHGLYDRAMQSLDKILLFEPERKDAIELKSRIQKSGTATCLD